MKEKKVKLGLYKAFRGVFSPTIIFAACCSKVVLEVFISKILCTLHTQSCDLLSYSTVMALIYHFRLGSETSTCEMLTLNVVIRTYATTLLRRL